MDLTWVKTIEILMVVKTFAASIAQTLVDQQVKFKKFILQFGLAQKNVQPLLEILCQP